MNRRESGRYTAFLETRGGFLTIRTGLTSLDRGSAGSYSTVFSLGRSMKCGSADGHIRLQLRDGQCNAAKQH